MTTGFIILRHVNEKEHDNYWKTCYRTIRKFYNNPILIIDDNSNQELIEPIEMINCQIINSEFKGRGEILPYYYFHKKKPFEKAVILHDSMFIGQKLNLDIENKFIWFVYSHRWNNTKQEIEYIKLLDNNDLLKYYKSKKWFPCYGATSIISINFLDQIVTKYNIFKLIDYIKNRKDRMCFERIIGTIFFKELNLTRKNCSYLGKIHSFPRKTFKSNAYKYKDYLKDKKDFYPIIKIWVGR